MKKINLSQDKLKGKLERAANNVRFQTLGEDNNAMTIKKAWVEY